MNPTKRTGLELFGLCLLALGLMALGTTAAHAEGTWMVKGKNLTSTSENKELAGSLVSPGIKLLATLGLNKVAFSCAADQLINAKLEPKGAISEASKNAKVKFSVCITEINGKVAAKCEPLSGTEKGVFTTAEGYGLLKLHETTAEVVVFTPKTGDVFATIHMSAACPIGEEVGVFGNLTLEDSGGNEGLEEEKAIHTIQEFAALTELKVANAESESTATLDGKAEIKLASEEAWDGLRHPEQLQIESCLGEGTKCQPSTVGTTFTATSENFVLESEEEKVEGEPNIDECNAAVNGEIVKPVSKGAGENVEISIGKVEFSKCTGAALKAVSLPWTIFGNQASFSPYREFQWSYFLVETFFGCNYVTFEKDLMFQKWDSSPLRDLDLGSTVYESGPSYCFNLRRFHGELRLTSVSDPGLAAASSLIAN